MTFQTFQFRFPAQLPILAFIACSLDGLILLDSVHCPLAVPASFVTLSPGRKPVPPQVEFTTRLGIKGDSNERLSLTDTVVSRELRGRPISPCGFEVDPRYPGCNFLIYLRWDVPSPATEKGNLACLAV